MKKVLFLFSTCLGSILVNAQDTTLISKAEILKIVIEQNIDIKIAEQSFQLSKANYRQTNGIFVPSISLSYSGMETTNPLMAFGSKLNQEILATSDFNPSLLNDPEKTRNFETRIEFQQPILNMDGVYKRKAAKANMEASLLQVDRQSDYILFEVEKAYMQLQLAHCLVNVMQKVEKAALSNEQLSKNSFEQGLIQYSDLLAVSVRLTEVKNQLQQAKSNVQNASDYLAFLMNTEQRNILKPMDKLGLAKHSLKDPVLSEDRADIQAMNLASVSYSSLYKAEKMTLLPRLNVFGSYALYDDEIFKGDANGYMLVAQFSWSILDGTQRIAKIQKSQAAYEKSKLEYDQYLAQSNLELLRAKRMVGLASNKLIQGELALKQSGESLKIRTDRFKEGLEKSSDLLLAESIYAHKELGYYQTIFEYNFALAYLQFLTKE